MGLKKLEDKWNQEKLKHENKNLILDEELCFLLPSVQCALAICFLMLNTKGWFEYRKLVKFYFGVDFTQLRNYMYRLNPKLTKNDLQ